MDDIYSTTAQSYISCAYPRERSGGRCWRCRPSQRCIFFSKSAVSRSRARSTASAKPPARAHSMSVGLKRPSAGLRASDPYGAVDGAGDTVNPESFAVTLGRGMKSCWRWRSTPEVSLQIFQQTGALCELNHVTRNALPSLVLCSCSCAFLRPSCCTLVFKSVIRAQLFNRHPWSYCGSCIDLF